MTPLVAKTPAKNLPTLDAVQQYGADVQTCGAPEALGAHLKEYDLLVHQARLQKFSVLAHSALALSMLTTLAPSLGAAGRHCLSTVSDEAVLGCSAHGGPAIGALCGLAAMVFSGYGIYLNWGREQDFVARLDEQLQQRFQITQKPGEDSSRLTYLMSRYSALSEAERHQIKTDVFELSLQEHMCSAPLKENNRGWEQRSVRLYKSRPTVRRLDSGHSGASKAW